MRPYILSATIALTLLACSSNENSTEPPADPNLARGGNHSYRAIDLGVFDAEAMNLHGQVAGAISVQVGVPDDPQEETRAIVWQQGAITDLTGRASDAHAINSKGVVVGALGDIDNGISAFRWEDGVTTDLGTLGGSLSDATGINTAGQVVGWSFTTNDQAFRAFLWTNGVMADLGTLSGGTSSQAWGINDKGQVVGQSTTAGFSTTHAFLRTHGVMQDLGTLGGDFSAARSINSDGEVVGSSTITPGVFQFHAFLWKHGVMTDLGTLGGPNSQAWAINKKGQVAGSSDAADLTRHAFVWQNGVMTDLGAIAGGTQSIALDITPAGDVVGEADGRATLWTLRR